MSNLVPQTDVLLTGKYMFHQYDHLQTVTGASGPGGAGAQGVVTVAEGSGPENVIALLHIVEGTALGHLIKRRSATNNVVHQKDTNIHLVANITFQQLQEQLQGVLLKITARELSTVIGDVGDVLDPAPVPVVVEHKPGDVHVTTPNPRTGDENVTAVRVRADHVQEIGAQWYE